MTRPSSKHYSKRLTSVIENVAGRRKYVALVKLLVVPRFKVCKAVVAIILFFKRKLSEFLVTFSVKSVPTQCTNGSLNCMTSMTQPYSVNILFVYFHKLILVKSYSNDERASNRCCKIPLLK